MFLMYITEGLAEKLSKEYYQDNGKKLNKLVDDILFKLKFADVNNNDFYSLANEIFCDVLKRYDGKQEFQGFLYSCLTNKFKTEMTRYNRQKRQADRMAVSWDTPLGEEEKGTLSDVIASNINIEIELLGGNEEILMEERIERYLNSLSKIQRKIIEMKMQDVEVQCIKEKLSLTDSQYSSYIEDAKQYEHIRLLHT